MIAGVSEQQLLEAIGRTSPLFGADLKAMDSQLKGLVERRRFLVIGGAGSIGHAVTKEIVKRDPECIHVVDISENNLVEVVRDIRSGTQDVTCDFRTFVIDAGSPHFTAFIKEFNAYDYVLNLSAMKHVRSEKDPYSLFRMLNTNIHYTKATIEAAHAVGARKFFAVSTDKAANPVNLMGASKLVMEHLLLEASSRITVSSARFANVAFSDGSLLYGMLHRLSKQQPISSPNDISRMFMTHAESGQLCLFSCLLGENAEWFLPSLDPVEEAVNLQDLICNLLNLLGYEPVMFETETEARTHAKALISEKKWPCHFFASDTTGEKESEEFSTNEEVVITDRFTDIDVMLSSAQGTSVDVPAIIADLDRLQAEQLYSKPQIIDIFARHLPSFNHSNAKKNLDQRM